MNTLTLHAIMRLQLYTSLLSLVGYVKENSITSHHISSYPIPSHPIPSHPIPSHPIPSHPIPSISSHHTTLLFSLSTQTCDTPVQCSKTTNSSVAAGSVKCLSSLPSQPANTIRFGLYNNANCDFSMYLFSLSLTLHHPRSFPPLSNGFSAQQDGSLIAEAKLGKEGCVNGTYYTCSGTYLFGVFLFLFLVLFFFPFFFPSTSSKTSYRWFIQHLYLL